MREMMQHDIAKERTITHRGIPTAYRNEKVQFFPGLQCPARWAFPGRDRAGRERYMPRVLGIRDVFSFPVEMEVYVDQHEIEMYLTPVEGAGEPDDYRLIIDRRILECMGVDPDTLLRKVLEDRGKIRVVLDGCGLRFVDSSEAGQGEAQA
jgi:hypothetical protein